MDVRGTSLLQNMYCSFWVKCKYSLFLQLAQLQCCAVINALLHNGLSDPYQSRYNSISLVGLRGMRTISSINVNLDTIYMNQFFTVNVNLDMIYLYQCFTINVNQDTTYLNQCFTINVNPDTIYPNQCFTVNVNLDMIYLYQCFTINVNSDTIYLNQCFTININWTQFI